MLWNVMIISGSDHFWAFDEPVPLEEIAQFLVELDRVVSFLVVPFGESLSCHLDTGRRSAGSVAGRDSSELF